MTGSASDKALLRPHIYNPQTKNAILLVDRTLQNMREHNMPRKEALIEAGMTRLRPILMTTLAMIGGMIPLFLALGSGAQMRAPMARAVVGGIITSTLLTLVVIPVFFDLLDEFTWKGAWGWARSTWTKSRIPS